MKLKIYVGWLETVFISFFGYYFDFYFDLQVEIYMDM